MKNQKLIVIVAVIIGIIVVIGGIVITPIFWKNTALMSDEELIEDEELNRYKEYSDTLKIYSKIDDEEIAVDFLQEDVAKLNKKAVLEASADYGTITIPDTTEFISFDIYREENDSPDFAKNFVYHDVINSVEYTIHQSGEKTWQHFNGAISNEFDSKKEAILDHLMYTN